MKLYWPVIGLLLIGCERKNSPLSLLAATSPAAQTTQSVYASVGQSNAAYMNRVELEHIRQALGAIAVVDCGVPSTSMSRWTQGGDLYNSCVEVIKNTIAAHPGSTLKGVMFWQGESDCSAQDVGLWAGRFRAMVEGFRSHWTNVPVVFAQITDTKTEYRDEMRGYQAGVYIPGVEMVKTDGIHLGGSVEEGTAGGDHTNNAGYATMAQRFVQALKGP